MCMCMCMWFHFRIGQNGMGKIHCSCISAIITRSNTVDCFHSYLIAKMHYCKTTNDSVQDIIANSAPKACRYFILHAIIQ